ncbi:unnamed protein product [Urochloa humidicola]
MGKEFTVLEEGEGSARTPRAGRRNGKNMNEQSQEVEEQVSDLFGKLNLTAKEKETLILEDVIDSDLAVENHAVIGKILSPSPVQLQTVVSAMKPAWGNPKGLEIRMVGDNLFIAEFESELDKNRALDGSPWYIGRQHLGRQVAILQDFNYDLRPSDVFFDELAIWIRILDLPFGLRDEKWGIALAGMIGKKVLKIDVDDQKKAVGKDLRARIIIPLNEPLPRGVSVFSSRRQRREWYDVVYEKLPFFCFSCGIIGHSEIECPKPATRDERGRLPYSEKLRAAEERRAKSQADWYAQGDSSVRKSNSSGGWGSSESKRSATRRSDDSDEDHKKGDVEDDGTTTPLTNRNQMLLVADRPPNEMILEESSASDKQESSITKKRKSDESLMNSSVEGEKKFYGSSGGAFQGLSAEGI